MKRFTAAIFAFTLCCSGGVAAEGFTFGGQPGEHPYPNEPQYQYPYPYSHSNALRRSARHCSRGQAPFHGRCRKIRWLSGVPKSLK